MYKHYTHSKPGIRLLRPKRMQLADSTGVKSAQRCRSSTDSGYLSPMVASQASSQDDGPSTSSSQLDVPSSPSTSDCESGPEITPDGGLRSPSPNSVRVITAALCVRNNFKSAVERSDALKKRQLPAESVQFLTKIGSGAFGEVHKAEYDGGQLVAVKTFFRCSAANDKGEGHYRKQLHKFKREAMTLNGISHVNVLKFIGWLDDPFRIVTELCNGDSLYTHLHVNETYAQIDFTTKNVIIFATQIAAGMSHLHSKNVIHKDLKSSNIFLTDDLTVKIGDFGSAEVRTSWTDGRGCDVLTGSVLWMAPEIIVKQTYNAHTAASDVYSYGVVLYELFTRRIPYSDITNCADQILYLVGSGLLRPEIRSHVRHADLPDSLISMAESCCATKESERPEFAQTLKLLQNAAR